MDTWYFWVSSFSVLVSSFNQSQEQEPEEAPQLMLCKTSISNSASSSVTGYSALVFDFILWLHLCSCRAKFIHPLGAYSDPLTAEALRAGFCESR
jgi:hypothetical protein